MDGTTVLWIATYDDADDARADLAALERPEESVEPSGRYDAAVIDSSPTARVAGGAAALVVVGEPTVEPRLDHVSTRATRIVRYSLAATPDELELE